jgi:hypothetical protein
LLYDAALLRLAADVMYQDRVPSFHFAVLAHAYRIVRLFHAPLIDNALAEVRLPRAGLLTLVPGVNWCANGSPEEDLRG